MLSALINANEQAMIPIAKINEAGGTQMRAKLDQTTVTEYAEALTAGQTLPPIVLFHDGQSYWLADGFHRLAAWKLAYGKPEQPDEYTRPEIPAEVRAGNRRDAILFAAGANASHGLRRTDSDKRRSVEVLLRDEEWGQWSNMEIARRCNVSESFVRTVKKNLGIDTSFETKYTHPKTGAQATMSTANIGANRPTARPQRAAQNQPGPGTLRAQLATTGEIPQSAVHRGGDERAINTPHIGANQLPAARPASGVDSSAMHLGAGRVPPPALTLDELTEDLTGYLAHLPAADIAAAARGARNKVLETALFCLQDMTYRTADLYRALGRIALVRLPTGERQTALPTNGTPPATDPAAALPATAKAPQPAQPQRPRHPKHDELAELAEIFRLTTQSLREWAAITGRQPDIQDADRALRSLIATTRRLLEAP